MRTQRLPSISRAIIRIVVIAGMYYLTARLGFLIALPPGNVTALWPPSGLAFASVFAWGWSSSLGVFAGSLLVNWGSMSGPASLPTAAAIAAGSTLQALIGTWLIRRVTKNTIPESLHHALAMIGTTAAATMLAPVVGVTGLCVAGYAPWDNYAQLAWIWWLGDFIGIMIFMPSPVILLMRWQKQVVKEFLLWPLTCFIIGLALFAFFIMMNNEQQQQQNRLELDAIEVSNVLSETINQDVQALIALRAFYDTTGQLTEEDFNTFTTPLLTNSPSISGLEWIPRIAASERAAYEQNQRDRGYANFSIYEKDAQGNNIPAADRPVYYPVTLINPFIPNQAAFGYDLGSDSTRMDTIIQACQTDQPTSTAPVQLVQESGNTAGILVVMPVYRPGGSGSVEEVRCSNLAGVMLGVYRANQLAEMALGKINLNDLDIYVYAADDVGNPQFMAYYDSRHGSQPVSTSAAPSIESLQSGIFQSSTFEAAAHTWLVVVKPGPDYQDGQAGWISWVTLLFGLIMAGGFLFFVDNRQKAEIAQKRQSDRLAYHYKLVEILTGISTRFINLPIDQTDAEIDHALKILGTFEKADRSYVLLLDREKGTMRNTHEWCAPGIESQFENLQNIPMAIFPWWMAKLECGEEVYIPSIANLPPEVGNIMHLFILWL